MSYKRIVEAVVAVVASRVNRGLLVPDYIPLESLGKANAQKAEDQRAVDSIMAKLWEDWNNR